MIIRKAWNSAVSPMLCRILDELGISWTVDASNGHGEIVIEMDEMDDARLLSLWDELSDVRARYIDEKQRSTEIRAGQRSFWGGRA
jgi:hypothetical protein